MNEEIKELFEQLNAKRMIMTKWQIEFVASLEKQFKRKKTLSERQQQILNEMNKYIV